MKKKAIIRRCKLCKLHPPTRKVIAGVTFWLHDSITSCTDYDIWEEKYQKELKKNDKT